MISLRGVNPEGSQLNRALSPETLIPVEEENMKTPGPSSPVQKKDRMVKRAPGFPSKPPPPEPPVYKPEDLEDTDDSNSE